MKKIIVISFLLNLISFFSFGQLTKNNWLVGGTASFSSLNSSSAASVQYKQTYFQVSPSIGFFLADKFATGIRVSYTRASNTLGNTGNVFDIGPFMRYYFLPTENPFNLFTDGGYSYGRNSGKGISIEQYLHTVYLSGGTVVYFTNSVGLELLISYSTSKSIGFAGRNNEIKFGIGFQIHLEKDD